MEASTRQSNSARLSPWLNMKGLDGVPSKHFRFSAESQKGRRR